MLMQGGVGRPLHSFRWRMSLMEEEEKKLELEIIEKLQIGFTIKKMRKRGGFDLEMDTR